MSGIEDRIEGKTMQVVGVITNDKELEAKGKAQEAKGRAKTGATNVLNKVGDKVDDLKRDVNKK